MWVTFCLSSFGMILIVLWKFSIWSWLCHQCKMMAMVTSSLSWLIQISKCFSYLILTDFKKTTKTQRLKPETYWVSRQNLVWNVVLQLIWFLESRYRNTGCFIWKVEISNGCNFLTVHIWPYVGKAKMGLRGGRFLKNCKQTAENRNKFSKN